MAETQRDVVKESTVCSVFDLVTVGCGIFDPVTVGCSPPRSDAERLPHPDVQLPAGSAHVLPAVRHGGELCRAFRLPHPDQDSG